MIDELVTLGQRSGAEEVVIGMAHRGRLARAGPQPRPPGRVDHGRVRGREGARRGEGDRGDPPLRDRRRQVPLRRRGHCSRPPTASRSRCASIRTRATSSSSTRWSPAGRAPRRPPAPDPQPRAQRRALAVPLLLHGDAAFPGQGVVAETLNLQSLERLLDRRHRPHHHRQPGGLHDRPDGGTLDPLRLRHGEGLQRPDHPRQRRRRRGAASRRSAWRWPTASAGAATSSST